MLFTKACPRCQGDVSRVEDIGDTYFSCVQCGHTSYASPMPKALQAVEPQRTSLSAVDRTVARKRRISRAPARPAQAA